jgi:hypothetical protein
MNSPSAGTIDRACRQGADVLVDQQRVAGASTHHNAVQASRGFVWVSLLPNYEWHQVETSDVTISLKGASAMVATQEELPGVEQEKIPSLERKIKKYQEFKLARMDATKLEVEAKEAVMEEMHKLELSVYKRPGKFPFKATLKVQGETLKVEEIDEDDEQGDGSQTEPDDE